MSSSEIVDFSKNEDSFLKNKSVQSVKLYGIEPKECSSILTICITVYKRVDTLKKALESAINQKTGFKYRIIVIDNCDFYDEENLVLSLVSKYDENLVSYYQNSKNLGMAGNWNRSGELATTPYFSIVHDDDLLKDNYVEEICKYLLGHKNVDCIVNNFETVNYPFGNYKEIKQKGNVVKQNSISANLFLDNYYGPPTCGICFKRISFISSGGFNQDNYPALDWFFMIYFGSKYNVVRIRKQLSSYVWAQNTSLKPEIQESFKNQRTQVIESLSKEFRWCKFLYSLLKKDFHKKEEKLLYEGFNPSIQYRVIKKIYTIIYGH